MVYQNSNFIVRNGLVPFRLGMLRKGSSPFPTKGGNFMVGNGLVPFRFTVPFRHVAEGVKPLPYERALSKREPCLKAKLSLIIRY